MDARTGTRAADPARHARQARRLTLSLMGLWAAASFGLLFFSRQIDVPFPLFGGTFSYWVAAQGCLVVYCAIAAVYAWAMNRLDAAHGLAGEEP